MKVCEEVMLLEEETEGKELTTPSQRGFLEMFHWEMGVWRQTCGAGMVEGIEEGKEIAQGL